MATWLWTQGTHNARSYNPQFIEGGKSINNPSLYACTEPIRQALENRLPALLNLVIFTFQTSSRSVRDVIKKKPWPVGLYRYSIFHFKISRTAQRLLLIKKKGTDCSYIADTCRMNNRQQRNARACSFQCSACHRRHRHYILNTFAILFKKKHGLSSQWHAKLTLIRGCHFS